MPVDLRQISFYPARRQYLPSDSEPALELIQSGTGAALVAQVAVDAASNQVAQFKGGNRATPADGDEGYISYMLDDSAGVQTEYARMTWIANDVTSTTKDSKVMWSVQTGDALTNVLEISSSASGVVTSQFSGGDIILPDNVSIKFGNAGADGDLSSDGTDLKFIVPSTSDLMFGRTGAPSPDNLVHIWAASSGTVTSAANTLLTLENSGSAYLSILAPDFNGIYFGDAADNDVGRIIYTHSTNTLGFTINAVSQLNWTDGVFAFQKATTISSTASLILDATGISGTTIKDEDNMVSDSATHLATQQSIKAYVDAEVAKENELPGLDDVTITSVADNNFFQYDGDTSKWVNKTFMDFSKITAPSDPSTEEARIYLKELSTSNNALAVKLQKAGTIAEVEITSPGAICGECGSEDGTRDPIYDFRQGIVRFNLYCGHIYETNMSTYWRII